MGQAVAPLRTRASLLFGSGLSLPQHARVLPQRAQASHASSESKACLSMSFPGPSAKAFVEGMGGLVAYPGCAA